MGASHTSLTYAKPPFYFIQPFLAAATRARYRLRSLCQSIGTTSIGTPM